MKVDDYEAWVIARIEKARAKSPLGVATGGLVGKTAQKKFGAGEVALESALTEVRNRGKVAVTNGRWWLR